MGSRAGAMKVAAGRVGVSIEEYKDRLERGEKWCCSCKKWTPRSGFGKDRTRGDGLDAKCLDCRARRHRETYEPKPRPEPGRRFVDPRDGDKLQARRRVNYLVEAGLIAAPNDLPCFDCGHEVADADDVRHEYDHHLGYAGEHHEDVEPVCSPCHHDREDGRTWDQYPETPEC